MKNKVFLLFFVILQILISGVGLLSYSASVASGDEQLANFVTVLIALFGSLSCLFLVFAVLLSQPDRTVIENYVASRCSNLDDVKFLFPLFSSVSRIFDSENRQKINKFYFALIDFDSDRDFDKFLKKCIEIENI